MGGEKFDTPHPEGYLFGENMDLNFLGSRPVQVGLSRAGARGGVSTGTISVVRVSRHQVSPDETELEGSM